jgi:hypothetical protein
MLLIFLLCLAALLLGKLNMANLAQNTTRQFQGATPIGSIRALPAAANTQYFEGAAVMKDASTGALISCTPTASGKFAGICIEPKDNRTGSAYGGTAGSTTVNVQTQGLAWLTVAKAGTFARGDEDTVYCSDDDTFTVAAGTNNIIVGKIVLVPEAAIGTASALVLVAFQSSADRSI